MTILLTKPSKITMFQVIKKNKIVKLFFNTKAFQLKILILLYKTEL